MRTLLMALAAVSTLAAADRLVFRKSFPGSKPPYVEITLGRDGAAEYREDPKDDNPVIFKMKQTETDVYFDLAAKLDHFAKPLESGLKVANMGKKTLRWEGEGGPKEQSFNFSELQEAKDLLDLFEKIAQSERNFIELEYAVRFDKLGVNKAVLNLETTRDQGRLAAPEQFLPLLDKAAANEAIMNMARSRAAALAESIRANK